MLKVKDLDGKVIEGLFKDSSGAIIIDSPGTLNKYTKEQLLEDRINNLENKLDRILEIIGKNQNG